MVLITNTHGNRLSIYISLLSAQFQITKTIHLYTINNIYIIHRNWRFDKVIKLQKAKIKNQIIEKKNLLMAIVIAFIVLSAVWLAISMKPTQETQAIVASTYTQHALYTYSATASVDNPLYPIGTNIGMGKPAYFYAVSPALDMSFLYGLDASDSADVNGNINTVVLISGQSKDGDNITTYWQKTIPVASSRFVLQSNKATKQDFTVNMGDVQNTIKTISNQLNYTDDTDIVVVSQVSYTGTVNGESIDNTVNYTLPITVTNAYYQVSNNNKFTQTTNITHVVDQNVSPSVGKLATPAMCFVVFLLFCASLYVTRKDQKVEPAQINIMEHEHKRESFKDSISNGKTPVSHQLITIEIASLKELVDIALDMSSRVILDEKAKTYFTIKEGIMYVFVDPEIQPTTGGKI